MHTQNKSTGHLKLSGHATKLKARRMPLLHQAVAASIAGFAIGGAPVAKANPIFDSSIPGLYNVTLPTTGVYDITAYGAQGGTGSHCTSDYCGNISAGGLGAQVGGNVHLTAGETLTILIGSAGAYHLPPSGGDGGGGSFVALGSVQSATSVPLMIAGGGGGGGNSFIGGDGGSGLTGRDGGKGSGSDAGLGGSGGHGGEANWEGGGGGGGFSGNGGDALHAMGGDAFIYGGGRWGGQGSSGTDLGGGSGGGGSGYSGGGGGGDPWGGGGGGGSFLASDVTQLVALAGANSGDGRVEIDFVGAPGPVPGAGLAGLAALALAGLSARPRVSAGRCRAGGPRYS